MQRKWRTNPGALDTVIAYPDFRDSIPPRDSDYSLADPTDLYAVYTVLHIESKQAELRWSSHGGFYYFLAQWQQVANADGGPQQQASAPEGDEDPPPQVASEGGGGASQQRDAAAAGNDKGGRLHSGQQLLAAAPQQEQDNQQQQNSGLQSAALRQTAGANGAGQDAAPTSQQEPQPSPPSRLRTQIVVPVSSACQEITPRLLQRLFRVRGVQAQQLLLALVDSNGVVTRSCLYNYIQAPLEGPGTANLELLDD